MYNNELSDSLKVIFYQNCCIFGLRKIIFYDMKTLDCNSQIAKSREEANINIFIWNWFNWKMEWNATSMILSDTDLSYDKDSLRNFDKTLRWNFNQMITCFLKHKKIWLDLKTKILTLLFNKKFSFWWVFQCIYTIICA